MIMINYERLAKSISHYEGLGYRRMEAPWWVSPDIMDITSPVSGPLYFLEKNQKTLVASGEQSFLYVAVKGRLPEGRYQTITPCFRDDSIGRFHRKCFLKNELINTEDVSEAALHRMIEDALSFFSLYLPREELSVEETPAHKVSVNFDITYHGHELGSYGMRECEFLKWIYGTGVAEPRMSAVEVLK